MVKKRIHRFSKGEKVNKREIDDVLFLEIGLISVIVIVGIFFLFNVSSYEDNVVGMAFNQCRDSDGGINIYSKGLTTGLVDGRFVELLDFCDYDILFEYSCSEFDKSLIVLDKISCPPNRPCMDGACA